MLRPSPLRVMESLRYEIKGKEGWGTRIRQDSSGEVSRLVGTSNRGHFATSAKDGIWVIIIVYRDAITVEELAI